MRAALSATAGAAGILTLLIAVLAAASVSAEPKRNVRDEPPASDAEKAARKTMAAELRRGRALASKGKHAEAVAAFDAALRAVPDEPHVLLELGVELRAVGQLDRAEAECRKVAARGNDPTLRAPALFNLGHVLEDKKDTPGAVAAYRESLGLRENRYVRERLLDLDPTAQGDATRPALLDGPFPGLDAWCAAHKDTPCNLDAPVVGARLAAARPPWKEARIFTVDDEGETDCVLAVRTTRGWFVGKPEVCVDHEFRHDVKATVEAKDVLAAPGAELVVSFAGTESMKDYDRELGRSVCCLDQDFSSIAVCGVGAAGVPACTPALQLKPPLEAGGRAADVGLEVQFAGDELTLSRADGKSVDDTGARLHPDLRALAGRHRILFP